MAGEFGSMTTNPRNFDTILTDLMYNLRNKNSRLTDMNPGSIIRTILEVMAIAFDESYYFAEQIRSIVSITTATGEYLDLGVAERGLTRKPGEYATGEIIASRSTPAPFSQLIPAGTLFETEDKSVKLKTTEDATLMVSETSVILSVEAVYSGRAGNLQEGTVLKQVGVAVNLLEEIDVAAPGLSGGVDTESDDALRTRYFLEVLKQAQDGNEAQYQKWAREYEGIGRAKVFRLWNGPNTVKVSILNSSNTVANQALVSAFQEYLDPGSMGLGNGAAPIGAIVTVSTAAPINLNVSIEVELTAGYPEPIGIQEAIIEYFADIAYSKTKVSYLGLAGRIQDVPSVESLQSLQINSAAADIPLGAEEIPVLGDYTCQVVTP